MKKSTSLTFLLIIISALAFHTSSMATKHVVSVGNFFFSPSSLNVNVGDTIRWVLSAGNHTTTSNPGGIPAGAASWDALINSANPTFEYKVTVVGSYAYVCTPHAPDMAGTFNATAAPTLSVAPSNRSVSATAGSTTFTVTSNSSWSASSNASWCTVDPSGSGNGTLNASYLANATNVARTAVITLSASGAMSQTATVTQAASTVGISDITVSELQVYPNPTKGLIKFNAGSLKNQILNVTVMDISGKKILSRECLGSDEYSFDISSGPKGFYFIRINSETGSQVKKIMLID